MARDEAPPVRGRAVLTGVVRDTTGAPRAGVRVSLEDVPGRDAVTDAAGQFTLGGLPAGTRTAVVRALGYAPQLVPVTLRPGRSTRTEVQLTRVVTLAAVSVRAQSAFRTTMQAVERRERMSQGRRIDTVAFRQHGSMYVALQATPCLRPAPTSQARRGALSACITWTSRCDDRVGVVFVDSRPSSWCEVDAMPPDEIAAVEVFARPEEVPPEFVVLFEMNGGRPIALVWRKARP